MAEDDYGTTNATPDVPLAQPAVVYTTSVRSATPDVVQFNDAVIPIEQMTDILFENIGGKELISISRSDIINGQDVLYMPIKNIASISSRYSPTNMFPIPGTSQSYFNNFAIRLEDYTPEVGTGPNGEIVYFDADTRDVVVNVVNMTANEQVEIQIMTRGSLAGDIMYGGTTS